MGKTPSFVEAVSETPSARSSSRRKRWSPFNWGILVSGAGFAAALLFLLFQGVPSGETLHEAGSLRAATLRLSAAPADAAAAAAVQTTTRALWARLDARQRALPAVRAFAAQWLTTQAALSASEPDPVALQTLSSQADAMAEALHQDSLRTQRELDAWLKILAALLAVTVAVPVIGLWRQRQRIRSSLHEFSEHLGSGDWQDAVQQLREDRLGPPSAFDALASGVEGVMAESERRWQALADLSADWYWETDVQHRLSRLSASAPAIGMQGWQLSDLLGRRRDQVPFYEAPAQGWEAFHLWLAQQRPFRDLEFRVRAREGDQPLWVSVSGRPRLDARGDFVGYEGVGRDITDRKIAHEKVRASEQRWSLMAGLASDWYWETDAEHRLRPMSPERARRFGEVADRVAGRTRWEAHRDSLSAEQWAEHRADLEARRPFRGLQLEIEGGDGRYIWISISGIPRFDGQGEFLGYHGVGRDITVRKQAERLLLRHNEELQRAVAERTRELEQLNVDLDAFSRQLAHELRTPIGHVQGLAHLLQLRAGERLADDERQLLDLQVQAAEHMRETVDALLLLARSTVQAMPTEDLDLSALAESVIGELPQMQRQAPLCWRIDPGLHVHASPGAMRIVMTNLMGNAAKFTRKVDAPCVHVGGVEEPGGRWRIFVQDNGAGFDPAQADRLFVPFSRLHGGEDYHGTGIGLTIVQRVVERHGGTVAAHGEPGRGARFEFTVQREAR